MDLMKQDLTIVMVDDDKDDLFLTKMSLKKMAFECDFVGLGSGEKLFEYIKFNGIGSIDIMLLDINMPVMDGNAVLQALKSYPGFSQLKVIMYSTSKLLLEKSNALNAGAIDFVSKPSSIHDMGTLISAMKKHLGLLET